MCLRELSELSFTRCLRLNPFAPQAHAAPVAELESRFSVEAVADTEKRRLAKEAGWIW